MASSYISFRRHIPRVLRKMQTYPPQQVLGDKGILTITKTLLSKIWMFEMVYKNTKRVWGDNSISKIFKHEFLVLDSCYSGKSLTYNSSLRQRMCRQENLGGLLNNYLQVQREILSSNINWSEIKIPPVHLLCPYT